MATTVRDTIKEITRKHLSEDKGKCYGQCLTAVGWVGGTLPEMYEEDGMVEFSMADVAGGAIATGIALAGGRPMYVVRYQGFQWYNLASVVNYAAKSKEIWNRPCPIFVRSIAMEGGVGPVAGSSHHSMAQRMPGIKVASPMTPREYQYVYDCFMNEDEPYYISEHRKSYDNDEELENIILPTADFTIFPISITRLEMKKLVDLAKQENISLNIIHQLWIKPFIVEDNWKIALDNSKFGGLVTDDDYVEGTASSIANELSLATGKRVWTLGLEPRTAGFHPTVDNLPPSAEQIIKKLKQIKHGI
jgi:acetoin:2,6-dichlorophenolindophenol oxidoreductase subunit beta